MQWRTLVYIEGLYDLSSEIFGLHCDEFYMKVRMYDKVCVFKVTKPEDIKKMELKEIMEGKQRDLEKYESSNKRPPLIRPPSLRGSKQFTASRNSGKIRDMVRNKNS